MSQKGLIISIILCLFGEIIDEKILLYTKQNFIVYT